MDLPDVSASIAPRRMMPAGAVNAKGDTAKVDVVANFMRARMLRYD
jgi:hypothetical protein